MKVGGAIVAAIAIAILPLRGDGGQAIWRPSGFTHIDFSATQGDWNLPARIYTVRFRMAPDSAFPAHYHGSDEVLTVIEGTFVYQPGTSPSRTGGREVPRGGVLFIAANTRHWGWAKGLTIVQINGIGPHSVHVLRALQGAGIR